MQVSSVSNYSLNCKRNNNVSFGQFLDENAYNVMEKALVDPKQPRNMNSDGYRKLNFLADADYLDIYTSGKKVVASFNMEKLKSYAARKGYDDVETKFCVEELQMYEKGGIRHGYTNNAKRNALALASSVENIELAPQIARTPRLTPEDRAAMRRQEEREKEDFIYSRMSF